MHHRLSPPYTQAPRPYRMKNAIALPATCTTPRRRQRDCSRIGPNVTSRKFRMVRFVVDRIWPPCGWADPSARRYGIRSRRTRRRGSRMLRTSRVLSGGGAVNSAFEGCNRPVSASYLPHQTSRRRDDGKSDSRWQTMAWTFDQTEELRAGQNKVEDLRDEEEDERLREVTLQCNG